jgi:2-hydroxychromene-2-carboxylate isomerase
MTVEFMAGAMMHAMDQPVFLYDVGSPWCWLAGERLHSVLGMVPVWQPVLGDAQDVDRAAVDRAALEQGLPEPRWPDPFPFDSRQAMLAATFAKQTGRAVAFSLAAMRQAFAGARDLSVIDNVLIAAAACELHPRAVLKAIETRSVMEALPSTAELGVERLPALRVDDRLVTGPDAPEAAADLLRRR